MRAHIKSRLVFALFFGFTAAHATDPLPTLVVQPHRVDIAFPAESLVEAVQQTTVATQIAGRVLEVRADAGQRVVFTPVQLLSVSREQAWVSGLPEKVALITLGQGFVEPGQQVRVTEAGGAR